MGMSSKSLRFVNEEDANRAPYIIHGTYDQWMKVTSGELRIIKALMKGDMTLTGFEDNNKAGKGN
jgi:hypothetical protein